MPTLVGYRYVMGERQGWGNNDYDIDRFAGIGMPMNSAICWASITAMARGMLTNSTDNAFAVRAVNPAGSSDWATIRPLVLAGSTEIAASSEVVSSEAGRRTVATYTATDPENGSITWSLAGTDEADFLLSPNGQLTFQTGPDFEKPKDQGIDNIYQVTVQASAGQQSATLDVTVMVTNANELGVVSLDTSSPQVGHPI